MSTTVGGDKSAAALFSGPGEMSARCRAFDWASSPLGPVSGWSQSLRTIVSTLLESRHPMFLWWGPDLIQIFNDGYRPSFGTSGRDLAALGARGREHWAEIWDIIGPQIAQVLTTGEATWHEDHLVPIDRNGVIDDVYWTYGYSPVRDDDGSISGVLVVVQETTARVKALAALERAREDAESGRTRLSELFRQAPAFIAVLRGPELVFEVVNDSYYQLVGHRDIVGKPVFTALPEGKGQGYEELLRGVLETGEPFVGREISLKIQRTPDAPLEQCYIDLMYTPIRERDGSISGIFAHGVDVTEQVRLRREAESARADADTARTAAEAANRVKAEFLATMSHELRTPLNAIGGYAQLLEMGVHGPVNEAQREALTRIQRSEQYLLSLVNDVLNFAKLEAGRLHYDVTDVKVTDVLAAVTPMVEQQLNEHKLTYYVDIADDVVVRADRDKLEQILLNLITNSIKFTDVGGVSIDIGKRAADSDGDSAAPAQVVFLRVSDSGIGIAPDRLDSIFDPFVQINRHLTRAATGTGLGLAISRDLARGMGGDLRVRSTPGKGSSFTVTLPAGESPGS
ncbi:MAG: ATP-binding protein [Gemmatimonadaceae bacterium]